MYILVVRGNINFSIIFTLLEALLTKLIHSHLSHESFQTTMSNVLLKYNLANYKIGHNYVECIMVLKIKYCHNVK